MRVSKPEWSRSRRRATGRTAPPRAPRIDASSPGHARPLPKAGRSNRSDRGMEAPRGPAPGPLCPPIRRPCNRRLGQPALGSGRAGEARGGSRPSQLEGALRISGCQPPPTGHLQGRFPLAPPEKSSPSAADGGAPFTATPTACRCAGGARSADPASPYAPLPDPTKHLPTADAEPPPNEKSLPVSGKARVGAGRGEEEIPGRSHRFLQAGHCLNSSSVQTGHPVLSETSVTS